MPHPHEGVETDVIFSGDGVTPRQTTGQDIFDQLFPELSESLRLDRILNLRNSILSDPSLASIIGAGGNTLGLPLEALASGGVPLRRAVNNLAFGLLPRFARESALSGTEEQSALLQQAPQDRFGRFGFGRTQPAPVRQSQRPSSPSSQPRGSSASSPISKSEFLQSVKSFPANREGLLRWFQQVGADIPGLSIQDHAHNPKLVLPDGTRVDVISNAAGGRPGGTSWQWLPR